MRTCRDCKAEKADSEFYLKGNNVVDCCCKPCRIAITTRRRKSNTEVHRRTILTARAWYRNNRESIRQKQHIRYLRNGITKGDPVKIAAREALHLAVLTKVVTKPSVCPQCGKEFPKRLIHGHHEDYSKPLEVRWRCSECHGKEHRKYAW